jgi:hypothetical protein
LDIDEFFRRLWQDYVAVTPQAQRIHELFTTSGERVVNDHVAFRTFDHPGIDIHALEPALLELGYRRLEPYTFTEKKLRAWSYRHPDADQPKIFFSELDTAALSSTAQRIISTLTRQLDLPHDAGPDHFWGGRPWPAPRWEDYATLRAESDYAAWVAALGLRANHFTVSVNHLRRTADMAAVVGLLKRHGFTLNRQGGEIKGSPAQRLEQAATVADRMPVTFADNEVHATPTCYYEFARRYPLPGGELYQGFVAANADKLFHSTDLAD